uniref:Putative secreted protein n=1 Tax=Anopheles darlingi TaxID=43151 RepID=A0A2M4DNG1_ANODA
MLPKCLLLCLAATLRFLYTISLTEWSPLRSISKCSLNVRPKVSGCSEFEQFENYNLTRARLRDRARHMEKKRAQNFHNA